MAKEKTNEAAEPDQIEATILERTALEIYLRKINGSRRGFDPSQVAREAFREAQGFAAVAMDVRSFGAEAFAPQAAVEDELDFASAPNLSENHPFNLGSRRFGNADTLATLKQLKSNPEAYRKAMNNVGQRN